MENFMPVRLGPMSVAPGFDYLGDVPGPAILVPFVRNIDETAVVEISDRLLRVWVDDTPIERPNASGLTIDGIENWTDTSTNGGQTVDGSTPPPPPPPPTTPPPGFNLPEYEFEPPITVPVVEPQPDTETFPTGSNNAAGGVTFTGVTSDGVGRRFTTIAGGSGQTFAVRIVVGRESIRVKIGLSGSGSNEIYESVLGQGVHSLLIDNPNVDPTITLESVGRHTSLVYLVAIEEDGGIMELPTGISGLTLDKVRYYQVADRIFVSHPDGMSVIERRGRKSWSVIDYQSRNGPWGFVNNTDITLRTTALEGDMDILANRNMFSQGDVGRLVRIASSTANADTQATTTGVSSAAVRVVGEGTQRELRVTASGVYEGAVNLERSVDEATWTTVESYVGQGTDITTNYQQTYDDNATGGLFFYRLTTDTDFDGEVRLLLSYAGGAVEGIARIVDYVSQTQVGAPEHCAVWLY